MTLPIKSAMALAAVTLACSAHAALHPVELSQGSAPVAIPGAYAAWELPAALGYLHGTATWTFSDLWVGALNIGNIAAKPLPDARMTDADIVALHLPVASVRGEVDDSAPQFHLSKVGLQGGLELSVTPTRSSTTRGGTFALTHLTIDTQTQGIYADVMGSNGVGQLQQVLMWTYGAQEGAATHQIGPVELNITQSYSQLAITPQGFDLFAQSIGLSAFGRASMMGVMDYGVLTLDATMDVMPIPEPSTGWLMWLGLAGVACAVRTSRPFIQTQV